MKNAFTTLLDISIPVVCAPMAGVAGGALAAAVHRGGGLGLMGFMEGDHLANEVQVARDALNLSRTDALPVGFGVLGFRIESPATKAAPYLRSLVALRPRAIWLSFGRRLEEHVQSIREAEKELGIKTVVMVMVGTAALGVEAASWGVDVVVAQGTESGGHGNSYSTGLPLLELVPQLSTAFAALPAPPLLLAAGGLSTASHLTSLVPLGVLGIVIGTALLATPESLYSPAHKARVLAATSADPIRTAVFDQINGIYGPEGFGIGVDGRALRNEITRKEDNGVGWESLKGEYEEAKKGDPEMERIVIWAGVGVGSVTEAEGAEVVVRRIAAGL